MPSAGFAGLPPLGPACPAGAFGPEQSALLAAHLEAQQLARFGAFAGASAPALPPPLLAPSLLLQQQQQQTPASPFALPLPPARPASPTALVWPAPGPLSFAVPAQTQNQSGGAATTPTPSQELLLGAVASLLCRRWNSTPDANNAAPDAPQDLTLAPCAPLSAASASILRALSLDPNARAFSPPPPPNVLALGPLGPHEARPLSPRFPLPLSSLRALLPIAAREQLAAGVRPTPPEASAEASGGALPPLAHVHVHAGAPPPRPTDTAASSPSLSSAADLCAGHNNQQQPQSPQLALPVPAPDWQRHLLALLTGGSLARPAN